MGKFNGWIIGGIVLLLLVGFLLLKSSPATPREYQSGIDEVDTSKFQSRSLGFALTLPEGLTVRETAERIALNLWGDLQDNKASVAYAGQITDGLRVVFTLPEMEAAGDLQQYLEEKVLVDPAAAKPGDGVTPITSVQIGSPDNPITALSYPVKVDAGTAQVYAIQRTDKKYLKIDTAYNQPAKSTTDYKAVLDQILQGFQLLK